jgi:hypothetical protein
MSGTGVAPILRQRPQQAGQERDLESLGDESVQSAAPTTGDRSNASESHHELSGSASPARAPLGTWGGATGGAPRAGQAPSAEAASLMVRPPPQILRPRTTPLLPPAAARFVSSLRL